MTRSDIAAIAQGLTKNQAWVLEKLSDGYWQAAYNLSPAYPNSSAAVIRRIPDSLVQRRRCTISGTRQYMLTPLGILVRDFLREVG